MPLVCLIKTRYSWTQTVFTLYYFFEKLEKRLNWVHHLKIFYIIYIVACSILKWAEGPSLAVRMWGDYDRLTPPLDSYFIYSINTHISAIYNNWTVIALSL